MYTWDMKTEFPWEKAVLMDKIEAAIAHFLFYTVHWRAFSTPCLCYFACWQEKLAKQTKLLPNTANHKQPSLIQGGQKRSQRGPEARQSTVIRDAYTDHFRITL